MAAIVMYVLRGFHSRAYKVLATDGLATLNWSNTSWEYDYSTKKYQQGYTVTTWTRPIKNSEVQKVVDSYDKAMRIDKYLFTKSD